MKDTIEQLSLDICKLCVLCCVKVSCALLQIDIQISRLSVRNVAAISPPDCSEPSHVGGAQEWGDIQRALGVLRQLDEHQPPGGDLHQPGRGQVLEDARVLHPRQHHQVPPHPG